MTYHTVLESYTWPRCTNAMMLMAVGLMCLAALHPQVGGAGAPAGPVDDAPVLRLSVSVQQGFAPLKVTATVHQVIQAVVDREVCLHVDGDGEPQLSCWRMGNPTVLVIRELKLGEGEYDIYAQVGTVHSNHLKVMAIGR